MNVLCIHIHKLKKGIFNLKKNIIAFNLTKILNGIDRNIDNLLLDIYVDFSSVDIQTQRTLQW